LQCGNSAVSGLAVEGQLNRGHFLAVIGYFRLFASVQKPEINHFVISNAYNRYFGSQGQGK
jgi:hypothetical protein